MTVIAVIRVCHIPARHCLQVVVPRSHRLAMCGMKPTNWYTSQPTGTLLNQLVHFSTNWYTSQPTGTLLNQLVHFSTNWYTIPHHPSPSLTITYIRDIGFTEDQDKKIKTPRITDEGWNSQKQLSDPVEKKMKERKRRKKRLLYLHLKLSSGLVPL